MSIYLISIIGNIIGLVWIFGFYIIVKRRIRRENNNEKQKKKNGES